MNKLNLFLSIGLILLTLTGCLQVKTTVNLNRDGSGTIEEYVLMKTEMINMMKEFVMTFDSTKADSFDIFNVQELKEKAELYGKDVKYVSGEKITAAGYEGYKVIYSFKDISKININTSPEDKTMFGSHSEDSADRSLKFNFKKGNPASLAIIFPKFSNDEEAAYDESANEEESESLDQDTEKLKEMFDGLKINVSLNLPDKPKETNAKFVDGANITLIEMDFTEVIKHIDVLKNLQKSNPGSFKEINDIVGQLPGIKIETNDKVNIKF